MARPNFAYAKRQKELAKKKKKEEKRLKKLEKKAGIDAESQPALPLDSAAPAESPSTETPPTA